MASSQRHTKNEIAIRSGHIRTPYLIISIRSSRRTSFWTANLGTEIGKASAWAARAGLKPRHPIVLEPSATELGLFGMSIERWYVKTQPSSRQKP